MKHKTESLNLSQNGLTLQKGSEFIFDHEKYNAVAQSARLAEVLLTESEYRASPECYRLERGLDEETSKHFSGQVKTFSFDRAAGYMVGEYMWKATLKRGRKRALHLHASYIVSYENLQDADEHYVAIYFEKLSRFTTYPYFRGFFSTHVSASGLLLPPLPTLTERVD